MSTTTTKSEQAAEPTDAAGAEAKTVPVEHSLLKRSGPDGMLLAIYRKVEKKLTGPLKNHLAKVIDCTVDLELTEADKMPFSSWLDGQETDSVYLRFQFGVSDAPIWVRMSRLFLTASVDCFFGGQFDGETSASGKLKRSEIGMIERLAEAIGSSLIESWAAIHETTVRFDGYFHDKDDVEMSLEDENVLISAISVNLSEHKLAAIDVVQSLDGLVAIEPQLNRPNSKEASEIDPIWQRSLKETVEEVFLPVRSVLARPTMDLAQLSRLAVGDILPVAPTDNVPLIVGDRVFAHGSIGEQHGGVAFQIKHFR